MADDTTVIVLNAPEVIAALERSPELLREALKLAAQKWLLRRQAELARYPAPPANSSYRRTGTLGRTWTSAKPSYAGTNGTTFQAKVGNATPYGPYVQGDPKKKPGQAKIHQGRWSNVPQVEQDAALELEQDVIAALQQIEAQTNGTTS